MLPGCGLEDAASLGERLRQSVCSTPVNLHGMSVPVTISLGITAGLGTDPEDFACWWMPPTRACIAANAMAAIESRSRRLTTHPCPESQFPNGGRFRS